MARWNEMSGWKASETVNTSDRWLRFQYFPFHLSHCRHTRRLLWRMIGGSVRASCGRNNIAWRVFFIVLANFGKRNTRCDCRNNRFRLLHCTSVFFFQLNLPFRFVAVSSYLMQRRLTLLFILRVILNFFSTRFNVQLCILLDNAIDARLVLNLRHHTRITAECPMPAVA